MKHIVAITVVGATLAGCSNFNLGGLRLGANQQTEAIAPAVGQSASEAGTAIETNGVRPLARPDVVENQVVVENTAVSAAQKANGPLGRTIASLGNPAETGLWLKTPMVQTEQTGRVSYNGTTIDAILIPIDGAATAGSRMSLQAFQALGAPLTDLVEVNVAL